MAEALMLNLHVVASFIALAAGSVAIRHFFAPQPRWWTVVFVATAVFTTLSGFLLPFETITPAVGVGLVATAVFAVMALAHYVFAQRGRWRGVYVATLVASLYLLVFVAIAQAFLKIPPLAALAPTPQSPLFGVAQLLALAGFLWLGRKAVQKA